MLSLMIEILGIRVMLYALIEVCTPKISTPKGEGKLPSWVKRMMHKISFRFLLCRLRSIATRRDHFVCCPSVCLPICPSVTLSNVTLYKAMFRRRHMHSSECCHYFFGCPHKSPIIGSLSFHFNAFKNLG